MSHPYVQRGVSLIEMILYIIIVGVALAAVLSMFSNTVSKSADPQVRKQALAAAEAMMEQILSKDYQDENPLTPGTPQCTPSTTTTCRVNTPDDLPNYNDVSDYHNWNQTSVYRPDGTVNTVLNNYSVNVVVDSAATLNSVTVKKISVTVASSGETVILIGYRASYE